MARRHRPGFLDSCEKVLNLMSSPMHLPVMLPGLRPVPHRRDNRLRIALPDLPEQSVRIERLIPDQGHERQATRKVMRMAGEDQEPNEVSKRIHHRNHPAVRPSWERPMP